MSSAGLPSKNPAGLSLKPDVRDRHHRPVLRPDDVVGAERVPEHHVGVLGRAVGLLVARHAVAAGVLVRVVAGRVALGRVVAPSPTRAPVVKPARLAKRDSGAYIGATFSPGTSL